MCCGQGPNPVTTEQNISVSKILCDICAVTLGVTASLYQSVRPLAGACEGTEGEAWVTGETIGRQQGAHTGLGARR